MHHKEIEMQEEQCRKAHKLLGRASSILDAAYKEHLQDRMFMDALAEADEEMETAEDTWAEGMKEALDKAEQIQDAHDRQPRGLEGYLDSRDRIAALKMAVQRGPLSATDYMESAAEQMEDRAATRDTPDGERSMTRAVAAFNRIYGHELTETEGWQFMSLLKKSRGAGGAYREDDYVDDIAYAALAAESAGKEQD